MYAAGRKLLNDRRSIVRKLVTLLFITLLCSCATKREVTENVRIVEVYDTLRENVFHTDSVFVRDSVRVWVQGDTIHHDRWRVEYRDRWRDREVEVIREKTDTLVQTQIVYKEEHRTLWQKTKSSALWFVGGVLAMCLIIIGFYKRVKG